MNKQNNGQIDELKEKQMSESMSKMKSDGQGIYFYIHVDVQYLNKICSPLLLLLLILC